MSFVSTPARASIPLSRVIAVGGECSPANAFVAFSAKRAPRRGITTS